MKEKIKLARYDSDNEQIDHIGKRIEKIEGIAVGLGYDLVRDKNKRRIGIGQKKPSITSLAEQQFGHEKLYRKLSGMAHSNYTTLTSFSFTIENIDGNRGAVIREDIPIILQEELVSQAATIFVKSLWLKAIHYGFDAAKSAVLFEKLYDDLKLSDQNSNRFWRTLINTDS